MTNAERSGERESTEEPIAADSEQAGETPTGSFGTENPGN